jgi:hypothetical protein
MGQLKPYASNRVRFKPDQTKLGSTYSLTLLIPYQKIILLITFFMVLMSLLFDNIMMGEWPHGPHLLHLFIIQSSK